MDWLRKQINFLNDPVLVARTQFVLGIRFIGIYDTNDVQKAISELKYDGKLKSVLQQDGKYCIFSIKSQFFYHFFQNRQNYQYQVKNQGE